MSQEHQKINAVFEGGGVKGVGLVGAVAATEEAGYTFARVGGTSAGAIVASLIAAGYRASELKSIMDALDYTDFQDESTLAKIPIVGTTRSIRKNYGQYLGLYFENWLRELLLVKGVRTFGDLIANPQETDPRYRYKLQVIAADISYGKLLVLPGDIADFGMDPDKLEVVTAARMSMSLPFFFEPVALEDTQENLHLIVDGGVLSNYPIWLFDEPGTREPWPTLGYQLVDSDQKPAYEISSAITFGMAMVLTMMEAHDRRSMEENNSVRTISIPTVGVQTTDFELTRERSDALYTSGLQAGRNIFATEPSTPSRQTSNHR